MRGVFERQGQTGIVSRLQGQQCQLGCGNKRVALSLVGFQEARGAEHVVWIERFDSNAGLVLRKLALSPTQCMKYEIIK